MEKTEITVYTYDDIPEPKFGKYKVINQAIIEYMVRRVRKTIEYQSFIQYMKKNLKINRCAFYKDYSMEKGFTIELHHAPITLFDIVETIANKLYQQSEDSTFEPWLVEETVNRLHYEFEVGLVPLNPTCHKLAHSDRLKIHPSMINGNWDRFATENWDYMSESAREKITKFRELKKVPVDGVPEILKYKPVIISNVRFKSLGSINVEKFIIERLKAQFLEKKE